MVGPIVGGLLLTVSGPDVPYALNAVTFLVSAGLVARIPERSLRSEESLTRGHWRDVADGLRLVVDRSTPAHRARRLERRPSGKRGDQRRRGRLRQGHARRRETSDSASSSPRAASASRSAATSPLLRSARSASAGSTRARSRSWARAGASRRFATSIWVAVPFVIAGAAGNGAAIVCNQLLVQRGAPDRYRGRALATIMSSNYAVLGLAMAVSRCAHRRVRRPVGLARSRRRVPLRRRRRVRDDALAAGARRGGGRHARDPRRGSRSRQRATDAVGASSSAPVIELAPVADPLPDPVTGSARVVVDETADEAPASGLERIASLLERIERRREVEARRSRR